jgi:DNA-binding NarL/FixJ family response regulator
VSIEMWVARAAGTAILVVSERSVEKHVANIFSKLGLAPSDADHRRVLAVLRYLKS